LNIPQLETERLIVREFVLADLDARRRLLLDAFGSAPSIEESANWMTWTVLNGPELARLHQPPYGDRAVIVKSTGTLIGSVGLVPQMIPWGVLPNYRAPDEIPHTFTSPEFGLFWAIESPHRGNRYAAEAAQLIIDYVFNVLRACRIVATTAYHNHASQRVMTKLGMRIEHNPGKEPFWFQVVGVLDNPQYLAL